VTDGLEPGKAGVEVDAQGFVEVDDCNRTRAATVYAVGDVNGGPQLAHAATSQGIVAAENACGRGLRKNEELVPGVIFTTPEVATVGLTESQAKEQGRPVTKGKFPFLALGRALAVGHAEGFVKWIADAGTDQLLGAAAVGPHATDLIAEAALAIRNELTAGELGRTIHAHPTFGEIWMEAAHAVHGAAVHAAPARKK
jgi:dihydrolipoamide dehydrogenase